MRLSPQSINRSLFNIKETIASVKYAKQHDVKNILKDIKLDTVKDLKAQQRALAEFALVHHGDSAFAYTTDEKKNIVSHATAFNEIKRHLDGSTGESKAYQAIVDSIRTLPISETEIKKTLSKPVSQQIRGDERFARGLAPDREAKRRDRKQTVRLVRDDSEHDLLQIGLMESAHRGGVDAKYKARIFGTPAEHSIVKYKISSDRKHGETVTLQSVDTSDDGNCAFHALNLPDRTTQKDVIRKSVHENLSNVRSALSRAVATAMFEDHNAKSGGFKVNDDGSPIDSFDAKDVTKATFDDWINKVLCKDKQHLTDAHLKILAMVYEKSVKVITVRNTDLDDSALLLNVSRSVKSFDYSGLGGLQLSQDYILFAPKRYGGEPRHFSKMVPYLGLIK